MKPSDEVMVAADVGFGGEIQEILQPERRKRMYAPPPPAPELPGLAEYIAKRLDSFGFTRKEREIAELMLRGHSDNDIALALGNSVKTIKHWTGAIRHKADVTSRSEFSALVFGLLG